MANKTIYDLTENQNLDADDLFEQDVLQNNERKSLKVTLRAIADKIIRSLTFTNLDTTDKTIEGAINELAQGGGGGSSTFAGLTDVSLTNLTNGQIAKYNSTTQKWENVNAPSSGTWTDVTGTLTAGATSITLSDASITTSSTLDYYTDVYGVNPTAVSVSTGSVTLTFEAQQSNMGVKVRVS